MIWNAIDFICRETVLHLRRERLIAIATVSTIFVLMLVLGAIVLFMMDLHTWSSGLRDVIEVRAYFSRDLPREEAQEQAEQVGAWPEVRSARFVPKEEGWQWLSEHVVSSSRLRGLTNPLPDSVTVHVKEPENVPAVSERLQTIPGVQDVIPSAEDAKRKDSFAYRLAQFRQILTWTGFIVSGLVAVAGIFIVHNTIRLALHARWREIYIMQLIGAGRAMIAGPFLLEGMLHGLLGTVLASCVLLPSHMYLRELSARSAPFVVLAPDRAMLPFGVGLILAGAILGLTGAAFSVRRYLRKRPEWQS